MQDTIKEQIDKIFTIETESGIIIADENMLSHEKSMSDEDFKKEVKKIFADHPDKDRMIMYALSLFFPKNDSNLFLA